VDTDGFERVRVDRVRDGREDFFLKGVDFVEHGKGRRNLSEGFAGESI
jgi:hypothetical protein